MSLAEPGPLMRLQETLAMDYPCPVGSQDSYASHHQSPETWPPSVEQSPSTLSGSQWDGRLETDGLGRG